MSWTCVVTTAPRSNCTLELTCESLADCGWTPVIFAEPGSTDLSSKFETIWNPERLGVWGNLSKAMRWAIEQCTHRVITVQDDVDLHPETKEWLDRIKWPADTGFISPYTPRPYQTWKRGNARPIGLNAVSMRSCWTGQSLAFERHVLEAISNHPRWLSWTGLPPLKFRTKEGRKTYKARQQENPVNIKNVDFIIGSIIQKNLRRKLYYPNPSLATHCNPVSSINHGPNTGRRNALFIADFSIPIESQLCVGSEACQ
jgi:hypothetical protein